MIKKYILEAARYDNEVVNYLLDTNKMHPVLKKQEIKLMPNSPKTFMWVKSYFGSK